jgi:RNA polymerase sigma-70 factor (ECF subfamily)
VLEPPSEVLRQFCHGDLDAFETLFHQHQTEVYGWIVRIVRDPAIAEDLTIETFWRIYRAHARFDPERCFGAWARRIATNAALIT